MISRYFYKIKNDKEFNEKYALNMFTSSRMGTMFFRSLKNTKKKNWNLFKKVCKKKSFPFYNFHNFYILKIVQAN